MKKINWKILIITSIICLLPMIFGAVIYEQMPEKMPVHFNINNEVDRYASKNFALFGIPAIMLGLQIFCCVISDINENKKGKEPKFIAISKWMIPIFSIVLPIITTQVALGNALDVRKWVLIVLGVIYILIGNYMPKVNYDQMKGLMMHPMPQNEKVYRKTIRVLGYTFVILGFAMLGSVFFKPVVSAVVVIIMIVVLLGESIWILRENKKM